LTFPLAVGNSGGKIGQVDRRDKVIIINSQLKVWPLHFVNRDAGVKNGGYKKKI
jgi:hypothetical protein